MNKMDNCLFYRVNDVATTFIVLFVDDTLIFSKRQEDIDQFSARLNRYYELTLDAKADSFLGIHIEHRDDGTVLLTQPKRLQKLFKEHPEKIGKRKARTPSHPYGPAPAHNTSNNVLTVTGAFDVLNQESTRHHDGCLLQSYTG
jgi:hypothetical protein